MNAAARLTTVLLLSWATVIGQQADQPTPGASDVALAIDQKLDTLVIAGKDICAALDEIGRQVGVAIVMEDRSAELLPWGRRTKLSDVTITNASVREALPEILGPLGMTYELRADGLHVVATEPLKRINRRATWEELKLLQRCRELEYTPENFATFKLQYKITRKVNAPVLLTQQLERAGRGSVAEMLEAATGSLGWVWLPDGDRLKIRTAEAQIANQLARRVTFRYEDTPVSRVLMDLADRAEVALHLEPGVLLKLPPAVARTSLVLQHSSIRQALNLLSAETGLSYEMRRDGLHVGLAVDFQAGQTVAVGRRSPYVGKISIPSEDGSYSYDILLREDDLPEDILEYRRQMIKEYIDRMRRDIAPD